MGLIFWVFRILVFGFACAFAYSPDTLRFFEDTMRATHDTGKAPLFSAEPYPFRDMTPHIRRLFDAYGARRCYWGSDVTNSFAKATYRQRVTHFTEELDFLVPGDLEWIMGRGLAECLEWP